jgi:hypothetical protein
VNVRTIYCGIEEMHTSIDFESNLGREEVRSIIKIYISRDGEWAIEEGFVRVGDRNTITITSATFSLANDML